MSLEDLTTEDVEVLELDSFDDFYLSGSYYFLKNSKEYGEKQLYDKADNFVYEFPMYYFEDTKTWVHFPYSYLDDKHGIELDFAPVKGDCYFGKNPIFYHTHPNSIFQEKLNYLESLCKEEGYLDDEVPYVNFAYAFNALPSDADVEFIPNHNYTIAVVSPMGIFSLEPKKKIRISDWEDYVCGMVWDYIEDYKVSFKDGMDKMISQINDDFKGLCIAKYDYRNEKL